MKPPPPARQELDDTVGRLRLGNWPTPILFAKTLSQSLGVQLYVKDDGVAADAYGGGKVRKLEHLLYEAHRQGHREVLTFGGVGSNQGVALAALTPASLKARLWLAPQRKSPAVRANLLAMAAFGAELEHVPAVWRAQQRAHDLPGKRFIIPMGGSTPRGNSGFVNAAFELARQLDETKTPIPDVIFIALGTMGSAAGLALGLEACRLPTKIIGVRASNPETSTRSALVRMCTELADFLRDTRHCFDAKRAAARITIDGSKLGRGYGARTSDSDNAVTMMQTSEALTLETTYTGKCLAALVDRAPELAGKTVMFWNTHSTRPLPQATPAQLDKAFQRYL